MSFRFKNTEAYFNEDIDNVKNDGSFRFTKNINNEKININKLDDVFKNEKISLKENIIIKLDLEGFDFLALKGLSETIQKSKVIIFIEISKMLLENSENFSNEFDLFIKNNRLNIYDLNLKRKYVNEDNQAHLQAYKKYIETGRPFVSGMKISFVVTDARKSPMVVEPYIPEEECPEPDYNYYADRLAKSLI